MQETEQSGKDVYARRIGWVMGFRIFWLFFSIGVVSLFCLFAPFLIGKYCSYAWGFLAGIISILAWLYLGWKVFLTPSTRLIWLFELAFIVFIAIFELIRLFHQI
jgi:hypothetical protein